MIRLFTKVATGIAPDGAWLAGDINAIQDAVAAISDFLQHIDLASISVGESGLQLLRYGTGEARISGSMRIDGIFRALSGYVPPSYTTTQRNAISNPPTLLTIWNSTTVQMEFNAGTPSVPVWQALAPAITNGSVTYAQLAAALKPSGTAGVGDEALRALGTTGSTAAAGNDARLSDTRTPTDASVTQAKMDATFLSNLGSGHFIGEPIYWPGLSVPTWASEVWGWNDGSAISRTTYATYMGKITATISGTRTNGTKTITGMASTAGLKAGMPAEGTGIPTSTTIQSVDSSSQVTLSANSTSSGTANIVVFPWGNGNGSTTFNMPDARGRNWIGLALSGGHADVSGMGSTEGVAATNRRAIHRHTNGLTGSTTLANHIHSASLTSAVTQMLDSSAADGTALTDGSGGGGTNAVNGTTVTVGNPTSNPTMAVTFGGLVGVSANDALDCAPYAVIGSCSRIA